MGGIWAPARHFKANLQPTSAGSLSIVHHVAMMLLRFTVENHRSLHSLTELTMVKSSLKTQTPPPSESWAQHVQPVAAIYGPNAAGKSTVLNAVEYFVAAVKNSSSSWLTHKSLPRAPFGLDEESRNAPSHYAMDFVHNEIRHQYGFEVSPSGIDSEWLFDYPRGRQRLVFERKRVEGRHTFSRGRFLTNASNVESATSARELFLSRAAEVGHPQLTEIAKDIANSIRVAFFQEYDQNNRIDRIIESIIEDKTSFDDIVTLLRVADIGIDGVDIEEDAMPESFRKMIAKLNETAGEVVSAEKSLTSAKDLKSEADDLGQFKIVTQEVVRNFLFHHAGAEGRLYPLKSFQQSSGTLAWLSLAVPALETLRHGGVFCVDEIDASLHPQLASLLVAMFLDSDINSRNAQLIFTTHDTYFIEPGRSTPLEPEQIWFAEKGPTGTTDLYSLGDFPKRANANVANRYLTGRYGAIPYLAPSLLAGLVRREALENG